MKKTGNKTSEFEQQHVHKKIPLDKVEVIDNEIDENDRRPGNEVAASQEQLSLFVKPSAANSVEDKAKEPARPIQIRFDVLQTDNSKVLEPVDDDDDEDDDDLFVLADRKPAKDIPKNKDHREVRTVRRPVVASDSVPVPKDSKQQVKSNTKGEARPVSQKRSAPQHVKTSLKDSADNKRSIDVKRVKKNKHKSGKKAFVVFFVILLVVAAALAGGYFYIRSQGFKGNYGQCTWVLDNNGVLTISGNGSTSGAYIQTFGIGKPSPDSIKEVVINEGVTDIPNDFAANMTNLTKVSIPATVTVIGNGAFSKSSTITEIAVAEGNPVYASLDGSLYTKDLSEMISYASGKTDTSFSIPDSVVTINPGAFESSRNLQTVNISAGLQFIKSMAFVDCPALSGFTVDPDNKMFIVSDGILFDASGSDLIRYCPTDSRSEYVLNRETRKISGGAFEGCNNLTSVSMHDVVVVVDKYAFYNCRSLANVDLPDSIGYLGEGAFASCPALASAKIPEKITKVPANLYWGCSSITSVTLPEGTTDIGEGAFAMTSIASIEIPDSVLTIGTNAFGGCGKLTSVIIPSNLTSISDYAFNQCTSLSEIAIPDTVTSIGYAAFNGCTSLSSVTVPDSVTAIGEYAFNGCTGLASVSIGSGILSIGNGAFNDCKNLTSATYAGGQSAWSSVSVADNNKALTKVLKFG